MQARSCKPSHACWPSHASAGEVTLGALTLQAQVRCLLRSSSARHLCAPLMCISVLLVCIAHLVHPQQKHAL
eukprot:scaffold98838_cov26-Tisochrysis_lutea.AAC.1